MATKTATAEKTITISAIAIARMRVQIVGTTPLITHRFSEQAIEDIRKRQGDAAKLKKAARDPEAEFRAACYRTRDGHYGFPAVGVKRAMVAAGQRFADEKGTELNGAFSIPDEMLELAADEPRMRCDRVVLSGMSRTSSVAYRPEFYPWSIRVPIQWNEGFISADQLLNLLQLAGFSVGIGDWRVEKKGSFGQFRLGEVVPE